MPVQIGLTGALVRPDVACQAVADSLSACGGRVPELFKMAFLRRGLCLNVGSSSFQSFVAVNSHSF